MAYEISWFDPLKIIYLKAPAEVSEHDAREADAQLLKLLSETGEGPIHAIIDDSEMRRMPGVAVTMQFQTLKHPRFGWTVVVGQKEKVYRMLYAITCHLRGLPVYLADTVDEAAAFIARA
jgi:hypothetical protein